MGGYLLVSESGSAGTVTVTVHIIMHVSGDVQVDVGVGDER